MFNFVHRFMSTEFFYRFSKIMLPILTILFLILFTLGLLLALIFTPADFQQGDGFRVIYIHVPSAILSLLIYVFMGFCAIIGLVWRVKLSFILMRVSAPIGAIFTLITLVTGAIWGKPMWGAWWVWDARLTSELILLFLYLGCIGLNHAFDDIKKSSKIGAVFVLIGIIDIPLIHFSVKWWNTLHQGASLTLTGSSNIAPTMLYPLLIMICAFFCYAAIIILLKTQTEILKWDAKKQWVYKLMLKGNL